MDFGAVIGTGPETTRYVTSIIRVSLQVSVTAVAISTAMGIPLALVTAFRRFPGRRLLTTVITTGMGFPSVVVGLVVLLLLSASGPLGTLQLAFTPRAMIISQTILALPVITAVSLSAVQAVDQDRKSTRLNSSHITRSRMPSSA